MEMIKAAVIGCGRMGIRPSAEVPGPVPPGWLPLAHAEALTQIPGINLAALCDTEPAARERAGRLYPDTPVHEDYHEMLTAVRPTLLTIATRTPAKAAIISAACAHGVKAIYVEKPWATSDAVCRASLEECARAGVRVGYGVNRRHHAAYREALRRLREGVIGAVEHITIEHGPAQLLWSHPHSADLVLMFAGEAIPDTVQATFAEDTVLRRTSECIDSDPVVRSAAFFFADGRVAHLVPGRGLSTRIHGRQGVLTIVADGMRIDLDRGDSAYFTTPERKETSATLSATQVALSELAESVRRGTPAPISPEAIRNGLRLLLAAGWSHLAGGQRVRLSDVPANFTITGRYGEMYA